MALFNAGVLFKVVGPDIYEPFCAVCGESFGTMTGRILAAAIIATKDRGGVMCPDCRAKICPRCNVSEKHNGHKLCFTCEFAVADGCDPDRSPMLV